MWSWSNVKRRRVSLNVGKKCPCCLHPLEHYNSRQPEQAISNYAVGTSACR